MPATRRRQPAVYDTGQIRKMLWWGIPLMLGLSIASFWMVPLIMVPAIEGIATGAPAVRVTAGSLLFPFVGVFAALAVVITLLRAIPYQGRHVKTLENAFNLTVLASGIVLALVVTVGSPLQDHYMPRLGYARCDLLQGNPTMWFTDWVKSPDLCVAGKTPEWVNEQERSRPLPVSPPPASPI